MSKIYKTFNEMCDDIGEQDALYVFEVKQQEIDQLKARIKELEEEKVVMSLKESFGL